MRQAVNKKFLGICVCFFALLFFCFIYNLFNMASPCLIEFAEVLQGFHALLCWFLMPEVLEHVLVSIPVGMTFEVKMCFLYSIFGLYLN